MTQTRHVFYAVLAFALGITGLHGLLNVEWSTLLNDSLPEAQRKLNVAYIPVT